MKTELTPEEIESRFNEIGNDLFGYFGTDSYLLRCKVHDLKDSVLSLLTKQDEPFKPCGEGENICNCKSESECGYLQQPQVDDAETILQNTINEMDGNFIFHEKPQLYFDILKAMQAFHEAMSREERKKDRVAYAELDKKYAAAMCHLKEIQSLKQANAELVEAGKHLCKLNAFDQEGLQVTPQEFYEAFNDLSELLSKHDKK